MKSLFSFLFLLAMLFMSACHSAKHLVASPPVILNHTDSIRTEYIETVRFDTVTVTVPVPVESSRQIVFDSTSHLESSLAFSDAWINPDGSLGHSLKNKNSTLKADVPVAVKETHANSSSESVREVPVPYPVERTVYVKKPPSAWEKFQIGSFWVLLISLGVSLLYIFRRPLLRLLCRLKL